MATDDRFRLSDAVLIVGPAGEDQTTLGREHGLALVTAGFPLRPLRRVTADGTVETVPDGVRRGQLTFTVDSTDGETGTDRLFAHLAAASLSGKPGDAYTFDLRIEGTGSGLPTVQSGGPAAAELNVQRGSIGWLVTITSDRAILASAQA